LNKDFLDVLGCLVKAKARFLVVGAHALAVHGVPRTTGDLDIWIAPGADNVQRVWRALEEFGAPLEALGVGREDLSTPGMVVQLGLPPRRVDLLTSISGIEFADAWHQKVLHRLGGLDVPFIGRQTLIRNKRATGRTKDLADVEELEGSER